jgi:hypothetical protein
MLKTLKKHGWDVVRTGILCAVLALSLFWITGDPPLSPYLAAKWFVLFTISGVVARSFWILVLGTDEKNR